MGFSSDMQNDQAYMNGIGRFNVTVSDAAAEVVWSKSKSLNSSLNRNWSSKLYFDAKDTPR